MAFARVNSLGWAYAEVLTSAQMNSLDIDHANAIDGAAGGTYDPSAPVIFGQGKLEADPEAGDVVFQEGYVDHASYAASRTVTFVDAQLLSRFTYGSSNVYQSDVTDAGGCEKSFVIAPVFGTLTQVDLTVKAGGSHTALPTGTDLPNISVYREVPGSASVLLGTAYDAPASIAAYEALHSISLTGLTESVAPGLTYRLVLLGEAGANAQVQFKAYHITTRVTCTRNYPG